MAGIGLALFSNDIWLRRANPHMLQQLIDGADVGVDHLSELDLGI